MLKTHGTNAKTVVLLHAFFIYIHTDTEINDKIFVYYILRKD